MTESSFSSASGPFLKSLGFPNLEVHNPMNHFDFRIPHRRILVIGPMGSGKTEFSSRVWRDSRVVSSKSDAVARLTSSGPADRRNVFFVRSILDEKRFPDYPPDALAHRGGYDSLGGRISAMADSFQLETLLKDHPEIGTWILDEGTFYDERLVYVMREASESKGLTFIFPTLILNFRREIFNATAHLLLENATDVFSLTAYCEHPDCVEDSFFTYRSYSVDGQECPAPYFDPLIIIGGDRSQDDPREPNYCTRCDRHHYLPGKDYTYLCLKPLGQKFVLGEREPLKRELEALNRSIGTSDLHQHLRARGRLDHTEGMVLRIPCLAEKALIYLCCEANLLGINDVKDLSQTLGLDLDYLQARLKDNGRPTAFEKTS